RRPRRHGHQHADRPVRAARAVPARRARPDRARRARRGAGMNPNPRGGLKMHRRTWLVVALVAACVLLTGCGTAAESAAESPSQTVPVKGTNVSRVILTPLAAKRIGLQTAPVEQVAAEAGGPVAGVPLSAV